eukprot:CAMPEP_0195528442 /NCGR_PEP_ID=MMETSP0794_2-20130614/30590_1 /TAXON_ID=515487 /ORGANISM="Stephanopyxis turris, Strain CCMP 815" /LENGTH=100 /DNA_ID=CAMNT_0040659581 /DNA_START=80 /DNA_END=382 /DNA_ORIENTATION=+
MAQVTEQQAKAAFDELVRTTQKFEQINERFTKDEQAAETLRRARDVCEAADTARDLHQSHERQTCNISERATFIFEEKVVPFLELQVVARAQKLVDNADT